LSKGVYYLHAESGTLNAKSKTITIKFYKRVVSYSLNVVAPSPLERAGGEVNVKLVKE